MIYLGLAILCACSIGLMFKYSETRGMHRYSITTINYLTATIIALAMTMKAGALTDIGSVSAMGLMAGLGQITLEGGVLPAGNSMLWAMIVGMITGFFFLNSFIYYQQGINESGIALSSMFSRLGVLIPTVVSMIIWQEIPSLLQNLGIALAIIVIVLVNLDFESGRKLALGSTLMKVFIYTGAGIFGNKLFQKYALLDDKSIFLLFTYLTALMLSLRVFARERQSISRWDVIIGFLVGGANLLTNYSLVMALSTIKAAVVFPISSAGAIITMTLGGVVLFGEKLRARDIFAVCITVIAVILINH